MDMKPGTGILLGFVIAAGLALGYFAEVVLPPWAYQLFSDAVCAGLPSTCDD